MLGTQARVRERQYKATKYPTCWKRVVRIMRRRANGHCQRCGKERYHLEVHHVGAPYANGRPGNPRDKHDIRLENLQVLCLYCHDDLEQVVRIRCQKDYQTHKRKTKRQQHRALGIGTGLVVYRQEASYGN